MRPTILATARNLWGSSAAGSTEKTIVTSVVAKPRTPRAMATGLPPGMRITSGPSGLALKANQSGENKKVGNEVGNNSHADENFIGAVDAGASLTEHDKNHAAECLNEKRDVGRAPFGVNAGERGREVAVKSGDERKAGGNCEPGAERAKIADCNQQCGERRDSGEDRLVPPISKLPA